MYYVLLIVIQCDEFEVEKSVLLWLAKRVTAAVLVGMTVWALLLANDVYMRIEFNKNTHCVLPEWVCMLGFPSPTLSSSFPFVFTLSSIVRVLFMMALRCTLDEM